MKEKMMVGLLSAMLSGGLSIGWNAANTDGRLTEVERSLGRIEMRLDALGVPSAQERPR